MLWGIRAKSKAELVVFHGKYNLDDIDVSEEAIVDALPNKKSS